MAGEPLAHIWVLVGRTVVEDHTDGIGLRNFRLDGVKESDELLMAVALHVAADDFGPA